MLSEKNELLLEKVGESLVENNLPLGFLMSDGFNKNFVDERAEKMVEYFYSFAEKKFNVSYSNKKLKDLLTSVYLLSETMCYVVTTKSDSSEDFSSSKVNTAIGTLSKEILQNYLGELDVKEEKKIKNFIDKASSLLSAKKLPMIQVPYNIPNKLKFPRKHTDFSTENYMVIPVSVVYGYVKKLRNLMSEGIVTIDARKTEGQIREFNLTSDLSIVNKVYTDPDVKDMFASLRSAPTVTPAGVGNNFKLLAGLHNLNFLFFEIGVPAEEYPKRYLNLTRIIRVSHNVSEGDYSKTLRYAKRYANVDTDKILSKILQVTSEWSNEKLTNFLRETINNLKRNSGGVDSDTGIEAQGMLDFQLKLNKTIRFYGTPYIRVLVDYVISHPLEFDGFTGEKVSMEEVAEAVVETASSNKDIKADVVSFNDEDDDLEWDL